jgi:hypothetical protein
MIPPGILHVQATGIVMITAQGGQVALEASLRPSNLLAVAAVEVEAILAVDPIQA